MPRQAAAVTPADLNIVVLVGEVTSPLVSRTLANGEIAYSFDMSTHTEEGRISVPVAIEGENATVVVGAQLCVVGVCVVVSFALVHRYLAVRKCLLIQFQ